LELTYAVGLVVFVIIVTLGIMSSGIKVVQPYERAAYFRRGRFIRILNPGISFVAPLVSSIMKMDMRPRKPRIYRRLDDIITADRIRLWIVPKLTYQVLDPEKAFFADLADRGVCGDYENQLYEVVANALTKSARILDAEEIQTHPERMADMVKRDTQRDLDRLGCKITELSLGFRSSAVSPPPRSIDSRARKQTVPKKH